MGGRENTPVRIPENGIKGVPTGATTSEKVAPAYGDTYPRGGEELVVRSEMTRTPACSTRSPFPCTMPQMHSLPDFDTRQQSPPPSPLPQRAAQAPPCLPPPGPDPFPAIARTGAPGLHRTLQSCVHRTATPPRGPLSPPLKSPRTRLLSP